MKLAVTGGTGFVGTALLDAAIAAGHEVRALARRPQDNRPGVSWISGDLSDREAVRQLVTDSDAIIHVAGVLKARTASAFDAGNVGGTLAMLAAATAAGTRRFVDVSSLAAREPQLSLYGASKARAEQFVRESGLDWVIVRPPAVYGPGDRETLELFRMARLGVMVMPPSGRLSLIHVDDLAQLLLALTSDAAPSGLIVEPDDGRPRGWSHRELGEAVGAAVGRKPLVLSAPAALLSLGAWADEWIRRDKARLTRDRAAYFSHRDWVVDPGHGVPAQLWHAAIDTRQGLAETASWYRRHGWL